MSKWIDVTEHCHAATDGQINTPHGNLGYLKIAGKGDDYRVRKAQLPIIQENSSRHAYQWVFIVEKRED